MGSRSGFAIGTAIASAFLTFCFDAYSETNGAGRVCAEIRTSLEKSGLLGKTGITPNQAAAAVLTNCELAVSGDAAAQNRLGKTLYRMAFYQEALYWFQKAVAQGNRDAAVNIGLAYYQGRGVQSDNRKAVKLISQAADAGSAHGKAVLGDFLIFGIKDVLPEDSKKGWKLIRDAAESGDGYAAARLGNANLSSNDEEGLKWLRIAVERGDPWGQYSLAWLYWVGSHGMEKNYPEFLRLTQLAAIGGDIDAQRHLAAEYRNGAPNLPKNAALAVYWYRRAAAQGDHEAIAQLELQNQWDGSARKPVDASIEKCGPYYRYLDMRFMRDHVYDGCLGTRWPRAGQPLGFTVSRTPPDAETETILEEWTECHSVGPPVRNIVSTGRRIPRQDVTYKQWTFGNYHGEYWCSNYSFATPDTAAHK